MNEMTATVEILLATYNGEAFLQEQLDSLFSQEGVEISIIARDDGSSDGTMEILQAYANRRPGRIRILPSEARLGPRGSFSALMNAATAQYTAFSDQDDIWLPNKLSTLLTRLQLLESRVGADKPCLVHCDLAVVDRELQQIAPSFWQFSGIDPYRNSFRNLLFQNTVTGCAALFNKALRECATPVPPDAVMHDHWMSLCASAFGHIEVEPQSLVLYRQHGNNSIGAIGGQGINFGHRVVRAFKRRLSQDYWQETLKQPRALWREHGSALDPEKQAMLRILLASPERNFLTRRWLLFKYGLGPGIILGRIFFWLMA